MKYHNTKNKILLNSNRKISISHMVGLNLITILQALISVRVSQETDLLKVKISNNIKNNTNNNNNNKNNKINRNSDSKGKKSNTCNKDNNKSFSNDDSDKSCD